MIRMFGMVYILGVWSWLLSRCSGERFQ